MYPYMPEGGHYPWPFCLNMTVVLGEHLCIHGNLRNFSMSEAFSLPVEVEGLV